MEMTDERINALKKLKEVVDFFLASNDENIEAKDLDAAIVEFIFTLPAHDFMRVYNAIVDNTIFNIKE